MKILLYGINFAPELTGIGKYTGEMAAWLAQAGHDVRVVTAPPYYPNWEIPKGYSALLYKHERWGGARVWRAPLWVPRQPSGGKRLLHLASFAIASLPVVARQLLWRPDVVWVVEPPLACAPAALCLAKLTRARAWLHIQDYEVDAAFALGLLKGSLARRMVLGIERWLMRRFDQVSTISDSMMKHALDKGVEAERLVHCPNWIDLSHIYPLDGPSSYRSELGIADNTIVALYSGNMGNKQGLEILADAARRLADEPRIMFVFCGNGAGRSKLEEQTAGLRNVRFLDLQPFERLNDLLGLADIHLLPQRADAADLVMPSKLTGMLASGRAVVATAHADTELGRVVSKCSVITAPGDADAFAGAVRDLAHDRERRHALGKAGREYAETKLNIRNILREFEDLLKQDPSEAGVSQPYV
ncbi:glycosyltransferase WbuB [Noviherbaspirillum galbum]|uniref:Glycosyltransferase WbuB n=1 Tax=Noviherbaspirillum galbum TaxID=2709383 RepID=A0A6B3SQ03_9BURK|nr:glycosyltransferase WbuB [Noviherbaspirillum galbum]NEX62721.1 glycosyltransferase WbuB [Noviherbaspirillum galbum]